MSDLIRREDAIYALLEKGQKSRRYKIGEIWELNFDEIREALATVPSAQPEQNYANDRYEDMCEYFHGEDAILHDRKEFKAWLERMKWHVMECDKLGRQLDELQKQKTGKWIGLSFDGYADGYPVTDEWECSVCGKIVEDEEPTWKYCPNCGARMGADHDTD